VEASRCAQSYNAASHPEVVAGRMTAERALKEFLETFDVSEGGITEKALVDYYSSVGSSIQSDQYFELLVRNTWNCLEHAVEEKDGTEPLLYAKSGKSREPSSIPVAAGSRTRVQGPKGHTARLDWLGHDNTSQFEGYEGRHRDTKREPNSGERMILQNIERSLRQRPPLHGYIALQRAFRAADEGTKTVPLPVFIRISKDLDLGMTDPECRVMFEFFNRKGMGLLDWKGFLECVRPPLSRDRRTLVDTAFRCLDPEDRGAIDASLIVSQYDPTGHPDVFLGVRSPEEVMTELLETFDMGGALQGKVTRDEFLEYFSNIGAGIDNEDYFELMLIHAWKPLSERRTEEHANSNASTNALSDEPEQSSHSASVSFDIPHTGSKNPRSPPSVPGSRYSNVPLSASMQNWIGANVDRTAPSPTANAVKYDIMEDRGPRHFNHRKSQIHFP
jgi:calcyphosin